jgi:hypothetical protein
MKEIKNFDYPLDEALKICKEYNMHESLAFLLEKAGFYSEALDLYFEVELIKIIKKCVNKKILDIKGVISEGH